MMNLWRNAVGGGLLISGVLAGCVVGDEAPGEEPPDLGVVHQQVGPGGWDEEANGRSTIGAAFETDAYMAANPGEYFSVSTTGTRANGKSETITFTGGASLKPSPLNPDLVGLILSSGNVRLRIATVRTIGTVSHYGIDASVGGALFTRACDDAVPLFGVIDRTGAHIATAQRITLMCSDGAGAKCIRFGYPAGLPNSALWGPHQACMQMVTADYCALGTSNTRTGTSIIFYDNADVYQVPPGTELPIMTMADWPPNAEDYYFEAAFRASHTQAVCSARARWPLITNNCVAALPDCPHDTVDHLIDPGGAMMFVASRYNQLRLEHWQSLDGTGDDHVSTVRGYFNPGDDQIKPPWPGYAHQGMDGVLLRVPPTSVPSDHLTGVALFRSSGGDTFVARSDDPRFATASFTNLGQEGFVYKNQSDVLNPRALRLYRNRTTGDRTSTTADVSTQEYEPLLDASGSNLIGWIASQ